MRVQWAWGQKQKMRERRRRKTQQSCGWCQHRTVKVGAVLTELHAQDC
jgi:hypothetical protein